MRKLILKDDCINVIKKLKHLDNDKTKAWGMKNYESLADPLGDLRSRGYQTDLSTNN